MSGHAEAGQAPVFYLLAAEPSGDRLGAGLMRALRSRCEGRVGFAGVGGSAMAGEGMASPFPIADLSIMGFSAIPRRLPLILQRIRETAAAVVATRPDALIIIDSPDFTHRVARRVRRALPTLPIIDYVSPSVWAWRPSRARAMRAYVDHVLALLPFEPDVHARLGGPPCSYVGHPLVEEAAAFRPSVGEVRRRRTDPPLVLLLPGSRSGELHRLLATFMAALDLVARRYGEIEVVLPTVPHLLDPLRKAITGWPLRPRIVVEPSEKQAAFRTARAALAASGTVTLELAVSGVPAVVAYRVSWIEKVVLRPFVRVPSIVLANLVLGSGVMPEFVEQYRQPEGAAPVRRSPPTPERLADALAPLLSDTPERRAQTDAFARLDAIMGIGGPSPSEKAAEIVLDLARRAHLRREIGR
jgi:lipid-A-disaccharide synthase